MNFLTPKDPGHFPALPRPILILVFLSLPLFSAAHMIVKELENMTATDTAWVYLGIGFRHILPLGLDHIFFILSLFLLSPNIKYVLLQSTAFTLAHSITLGLSMYHIINPPSRIIEPLIALSIVYVAMENILSPKLKPSRLVIIFIFGLVHGMGFAGALAQLGLPKDAFLLSLLMFNVGVELGQVTVIALAFILVNRFSKNSSLYKQRIVWPVSLFIALVAGFWTIQRLFF